MKNILVLTSDMNLEYCITVTQGLTSFFNDKNDIHLIITQVKSKDDRKGTYTYQLGSVMEMITTKDIDGYIILSTTFGSFLTELIEKIRNKNSKPILSIGVQLSYKNCYTVACNTKQIYEEIVGHLIHEHNCKRIGFFSAKETHSHEAEERFQSYLDALKFHGLEYNPDYILDGNFTKYYSKQVIAQKYQTKEEVPFDSIICANDFTALGCIEGFSKLGISIPEELKIIGFDDTSQASLSEPSISTVSQQIAQQGYTAAQLIYKLLNGENISEYTEIDLAPIYRQTCGCIEKTNNNYVYKDKNGNLINQDKNYREYISTYYDRITDARSMYVIFDFIHSNNTLENFVDNLDNLLNYTKFKGISVSLYENPIIWHAGEDFNLPEKVHMVSLIERNTNTKINYSKKDYNPAKTLIPKEFDKTPGFFLLYPIYNCSTNYGYFLSHFEEQKIEIYSVFLKIINQAIAQATEFSRTLDKNHQLEIEKINLEKTNSDLAKQSKTDELTKILNRRGFMDYGQQQINLSISMDATGVVLFADLDRLKKINDTYGHDMGDLAIQIAAKALKATFRQSDIVGRLSGDEFAVVASAMELSHLDETRKEIEKNCRALSIEYKLPFEISLSVGAVEYSENSYYLKELLTKADDDLYLEKEKHHKIIDNK